MRNEAFAPNTNHGISRRAKDWNLSLGERKGFLWPEDRVETI